MNQSAPIVDIRNLDYAVGGRPIFAGLDIQIPRGKITAVMGPSGTGKTTLLRLITGQVIADGGAIDVAGENLRAISRTNLYVLRRRMGMLFQNGAMLTDLSVFENVAFPLREHTDLPVAVGLGVNTRDQAAEVAAFADGVIVGSAFVRRIAQAPGPDEAVAAVRVLTADLAEGVRRPR